MPGQKLNTGGKPYLYIVNGNFAQKVDAGTKDAKLREYELPNKTKGSKYELQYKNWEGKIIGMEFKDGDYGEQCYIELDDSYITLNTSTRYFMDFASKIFSGDITKPFLFHPYSMENDGKINKGISLQQDKVKLRSFFWDDEAKKKLHGFPEVDLTKAEKKNYWKIYFAEVTEFLIEKLKELEFEKPVVENKEEDTFEPLAKDEVEFSNDLPF